MHTERVDGILRDVYGPRRWIVALDVLQNSVGYVKRLRGWGAPRCLVIAGRNGTGDPPSAEDCDAHVLGLPNMGMTEAIHAAEDALRALPADVVAAVDAFDPAREARVLGAFFSDGRPVAGRSFWGTRPAAWQALEDKTVIDAVWDAIGVPHAAAEIVPVELEALRAAAARLDRGDGTVWAGDSREGFHGGADYTCLVRDGAAAVRAFDRLRTRCDRARVMPFLEGVPCSIHGVVFPDHVLVLRPAEMVVLRHPSGPTGFLYARAATFWDPPAADREVMRATAKRVGEHLRATLGYRGAFTVDGVMTADGFRPTELNPRVGAALGMMAPAPFTFLSDALVEGVDADWRAAELEEELLAASDARRSGRIGLFPTRRIEATTRDRLCWTGDAWRQAREDEPADGELVVGPGPVGGMIGVALVPERTPVGPSVAPRAVALARYVDERYDAGIGEVSAAIPRR